jgi:ABC-type transport system substrate-binding protein
MKTPVQERGRSTRAPGRCGRSCSVSRPWSHSASLPAAAASEGGEGRAAADGTIAVNWGTEPPSLDPGLATDTTSSSILLNLMDPLVILTNDPEPVPNLSESWDITSGGRIVTFHLRPDGRWTNGDPVTARDFEFSWKRTISPDLGADYAYAYQFFGIVGSDHVLLEAWSCLRLRGTGDVSRHSLESARDSRSRPLARKAPANRQSVSPTMARP